MFGMSLPVKPRDREALPLGSSLTKRSLAPWRAGMLLQRDKSARHALLRFRPRVRVNNSNNHKLLLRQTASSGSAHTLATAGSAASLGHVKTADNNSSNAAMPRAANPLLFLQESCPPDVLPLILAFCGPQQAAVLQRTNRHWRDLLAEETTWKVLCQELYKWKEGDPEPNSSWKNFYRMSPCVPVDYPTVEAALKLASAPPTHHARRPLLARQRKSIRVLLRPGTYPLAEGIHVQAPAGVAVSVESIVLPPTIRWYRSLAAPPTVPAPREEQAPTTRRVPPHRSIFQRLRCSVGARQDRLGEEPTEHSSSDEEGVAATWQWEEETYLPLVPLVPPTRATLVMRSRRTNEPMVRVRQGQIILVDIDLEHSCHGTDIWNGNAAIQIQPPVPEAEDQVLRRDLRPRASLTRCRVKSKTGRGVVNIDGGHVDVVSCFIGGCAATGLYVGGPGSSATVQYTDVYNNGRGNPRRRGIARGHSGVYLEQGVAVLDDCLVAANTLTGISAVSSEKAFLTLRRSTVAQNGTNEMELPPLGTVARRESVLEDNALVTTESMARASRSGLWKAV